MTDPQQQTTTKPVLIWDVSIRLFHWLVVGLFVFQWASAELLDDAMQWHVYGGYAMLVLLLFRIMWGLIGPEYARFANWPLNPKAILDYSRQLLSQTTPHHSGHNPLGALFIVAMLLLLLVQNLSGLFISDDILIEGPYYGVLPGDWQSLMGQLHHSVIELLYVIIAIHISAIVFYRFYKGENLVKAMLTGYKTYGTGINNQRLGWALLCLIIAALALYLLLSFAPEPELYY